MNIPGIFLSTCRPPSVLHSLRTAGLGEGIFIRTRFFFLITTAKVYPQRGRQRRMHLRESRLHGRRPRRVTLTALPLRTTARVSSLPYGSLRRCVVAKVWQLQIYFLRRIGGVYYKETHNTRRTGHANLARCGRKSASFTHTHHMQKRGKKDTACIWIIRRHLVVQVLNIVDRA